MLYSVQESIHSFPIFSPPTLQPIATGETDESSEDDDEDSLEDESSSSEEEEEEVCVEIKGTPLEWDDSTMKF